MSQGQDPRKIKGMTTPRDAYRNKRRAEMSADDSLMVEAYGSKGAAARRTAATAGRALAEADAKREGFIDKVKRKVREALD